MWLFQEGERVSSDRLLRVRVKQPFSWPMKAQKNTLTNPPVWMEYYRMLRRVLKTCVPLIRMGNWKNSSVCLPKANQYKGRVASTRDTDLEIGWIHPCVFFIRLKCATTWYTVLNRSIFILFQYWKRGDLLTFPNWLLSRCIAIVVYLIMERRWWSVSGGCGKWYHIKCIVTNVHRNQKWFCKNCTS